jgi:hypothetical protein
MSDASSEAKLARLEELEHRFAEAVERAKASDRVQPTTVLSPRRSSQVQISAVACG